jgi:hypothetical protein
MDPVPNPQLLRTSGRVANWTQDLWVCSQELWALDQWPIFVALSLNFRLMDICKGVRTLIGVLYMRNAWTVSPWKQIPEMCIDLCRTELYSLWYPGRGNDAICIDRPVLILLGQSDLDMVKRWTRVARNIHGCTEENWESMRLDDEGNMESWY